MRERPPVLDTRWVQRDSSHHGDKRGRTWDMRALQESWPLHGAPVTLPVATRCVEGMMNLRENWG